VNVSIDLDIYHEPNVPTFVNERYYLKPERPTTRYSARLL
jgi:hypothetical protein